MTTIEAYEQGFLTKCAEYGIDGRELLKQAGFKEFWQDAKRFGRHLVPWQTKGEINEMIDKRLAGQQGQQAQQVQQGQQGQRGQQGVGVDAVGYDYGPPPASYQNGQQNTQNQQASQQQMNQMRRPRVRNSSFSQAQMSYLR